MDDEIQNGFDANVLKARKLQYQIHPLLVSRTSPREMTGQEMTDAELFPLFEAARWAPSHYNFQPWHMVYAKRNSVHWFRFLDLLWPLNKKWAQNAAVLVAIVSKTIALSQGKLEKNQFHSFDSGSAFLSLALEGNARGYAVHAMAGIDYDRAYQVLKLSKGEHCLNAIVAIGKRPPDDKRRDEGVSQRRAVQEFVFEGEFVNRDEE